MSRLRGDPVKVLPGCPRDDRRAGVVTKPSVQTIQIIARSLGVSMEELFK